MKYGSLKDQKHLSVMHAHMDNCRQDGDWRLEWWRGGALHLAAAMTGGCTGAHKQKHPHHSLKEALHPTPCWVLWGGFFLSFWIISHPPMTKSTASSGRKKLDRTHFFHSHPFLENTTCKCDTPTSPPLLMVNVLQNTLVSWTAIKRFD